MSSEAPLIVAFAADLFYSPRIESTARAIGCRFHLIERLDQVAPATPEPSQQQLGEHLFGQTGALVEKMVALQPALIVVDLTFPGLPWKPWISVLKSAPATRRIPLIAFGPHIDAEKLNAAREAGADLAVPRSRFTRSMADLFQEHLRLVDRDALAAACQEPLSDLAREGLRLFNAGEYFEAHEVLEDAWNADETAAKELYRAILQVGVAYLQIQRRNYRGAVKMFLRVQQWLKPLPDQCRGVDIARLRSDSANVEAALRKLGPEKIGEFDPAFFKPVIWDEAE
jgi:CheY-like chemotaxis protein